MKTNYSSKVTSTYSRHAQVRMQQRCIPAEVVELLLDFACPIPVGNGAYSYRFDKRIWAEATATLGPRFGTFSKFRNVYVVEAADGTIITTAWLH